MRTRTVEWPVPPAPGTGVPQGEGLRERKKRLMRQQLSDTATQMFLEQGFDAVRVTEIAEACGVSEKTVFNYFPTKESLILDRLEATVAWLRTGLAEPEVPPVQAALRILDGELGAMTSWLAAQDDPVQAGVMVQRFGALIAATPSLRAHQSDMMDQFTAVAAAILAERAGLSPQDPEPQITATALLGLWRIQFQALSRYLDGTRTPAQVHQAVTADVRRAAQLINTGLNSLTATTPGPDQRLTVWFARAGRFSGSGRFRRGTSGRFRRGRFRRGSSGGFRGGRRCFRRRRRGWCEPGRGDVGHHDRHDHQWHDGHAV
jgi:AcrR family transcriptional regulator